MKLIDDLVEAYLFQSYEIKNALNANTGEIMLDADPSVIGEDAIDWDSEEADDFYPIPTIESSKVYDVMVQFARELKQEEGADKLFDALDRRRPFRQFKDMCIELGRIDRWHQYENEYAKQQIVKWLEDEGLSYEELEKKYQKRMKFIGPFINQ